MSAGFRVRRWRGDRDERRAFGIEPPERPVDLAIDLLNHRSPIKRGVDDGLLLPSITPGAWKRVQNDHRCWRSLLANAGNLSIFQF